MQLTESGSHVGRLFIPYLRTFHTSAECIVLGLGFQTWDLRVKEQCYRFQHQRPQRWRWRSQKTFLASRLENWSLPAAGADVSHEQLKKPYHLKFDHRLIFARNLRKPSDWKVASDGSTLILMARDTELSQKQRRRWLDTVCQWRLVFRSSALSANLVFGADF